MSYSRSKKITNSEKKFQALKTQLYGKISLDQDFSIKKSSVSPKQTSNIFRFETSLMPNKITPQNLSSTQDNFVKNDLLKILLLSSIAIGAQLGLYFTLNLNYIKF